MRLMVKARVSSDAVMNTDGCWSLRSQFQLLAESNRDGFDLGVLRQCILTPAHTHLKEMYMHYPN